MPGSLLKYTQKNGKDDDPDAGTSTVTEIFNYASGQTVLTVTDDVGDTPRADKRYERSVKGWDKVLTRLKELVEA